MAKKTSPVNKTINKTEKLKTKARLSHALKALLERADCARREFRYKEAIELYTQAIDSGKLDASHEFDARNSRQDIHSRYGDAQDAQIADIKEMLKLASSLKDSTRQTRAKVEELKAFGFKDRMIALPKAKVVLKKARQSNNKALEAAALDVLGIAYFLNNNIQAAAGTGKSALTLYKGIGEHTADEWLALIHMGYQMSWSGNTKEGRLYLEEALETSRFLGDKAFEAETLHQIATNTNDFAKQLALYHQALRLRKELGLLYHVARSYNNLSITYTNLGLYRKARDMGEMAVQISRDVDKVLLASTLETLARPHLVLRDYEKPLRMLEEGLIIAKEQKDLTGEAVNLQTQGQAAFAQEKLKEARQYLQTSLKKSQQTSNVLSISSTQAWLAAIELALGNEKLALRHSLQAVTQLETTENITFDYPPQEVWWWRYKVLTKTKSKKEAFEALQKARQLMLHQVENISDEGLRRNYLNKVEINRGIMLEWAKASKAHKLPLELPETRAGSLSEQLRRITEIGAQLNEHHDEEELLDLILDEVVELSGAERAILLLKEESGNLKPSAGYLLTQKELSSLAAELTDHAARNRQPILSDEPPAKKVPSYLQRIHLAVPLLLRGQLLGVLYADMRRLFGKLNEEDLNLLSVLCNQAASALENARLVRGLEQKVEERTKQLNARVDELAILNSVGEAMAKTLDVKTVTRIVGDKVRDIFDAEAVSINLLEPSTQLIHPIYEYDKGEGGHIDYMQPFPLGKGLNSKVIQSRQPLLLGTLAEQIANGAIATPEQLEQDSGVTTQSWVGVPIMINDQVLGTVNISHYREHAYNENHLRLLETLASNMGVAIENARLFEAEQQRVAELQVINSIQQGLASELDFQAIVDLVGDKLREVFKTPDLNIHWYDENAKLLLPLYTYEHGKRLMIPASGIGPGGLFETISKTRKPILFKTRADYEKYNSKPVEGTDPSKSMALVPIISSDRVLGFIALENFERENAYGEAELRLLTTIAASLGTALENARLFDETQQRNAELAIINSVQEGLASKLEMQAIYDLVGDKIREIFDAQSVFIAIYHAETDIVSFPYWVGSAENRSERFHIPPEAPSGFSGQVIRTRQLIVINEDMDRRAHEVGSTSPVGRPFAKSGIYVPIQSGESVLGVISLLNIDREKAFSESDVRLLQTLANAMSVALQNAHLFKAEQERVAELQIINSIQQGLASKLEMQVIYELIGNKLQEIFKTHSILISLYDRESDLFHFPYLSDRGKRFTQHPIPLAKNDLSFHVMGSRQPLLIQDVENSEFEGVVVGEGAGMSKSAMFVPLMIGNEVHGLLAVEDEDRKNAFSDSDFRILQTLANSMSIALENARLFDEVQKKNTEITESLEQQTATSNVLRAIAGSPTEIRPVLDAVAENAARLCEANDVQIYQVDGESLRQITHYGPLPALDDGEALPLIPGLVTGRAVLEHRTIHIEDSQNLSEDEYPESVKLQKRLHHRTTIATPLLKEGRAIGAIVVRRNEVRPFTEKQISLLATFADQAAIAIENVRLFTETQRLLKQTEQRNAELAIINSVQAALAAELNIQGIYEAVGDKIREIFQNRDMNIRIFDPEANLLHFPYSYENGKRLFIPNQTLPEQGFTPHVLHTRETLVINQNMAQEMEKYGSFWISGTANEKSSVFVPLVTGDQARGLINLVDMEHEHAFSESDVRLLQTLANSMSVALENARLFDETQRLLKETEQRNAELAIINRVQEGLVAKMDMQAIIDLVGDKIGEVFNTDGVGIQLYDRQKNLVYYPYVMERGRRLTIEARPPHGFRQHVIETRRPIVINQDMERISAEFGNPTMLGEDIKSGVWMPMIVDDEVTGIISLQNIDRENTFSDSDVRLLQTLANSMSVALENARLFDETQRLLKETEQRAAELQIINSVQQGLASKLEMQAIYDLVGDKIRDIFDAQAVIIAALDPVNQMEEFKYNIEKGWRHYPLARRYDAIRQYMLDTRQLYLNNHMTLDQIEQAGGHVVEGTLEPKSVLFVPLMVGQQITGYVSLQNVDRFDAFSDSDVRLLQTLANSMSVALENARLFDETQLLFKAEQQRAAELAIINSVQEGLASKLDMRAIYDLVGDKIQEIFDAQVVTILTFDTRTNRSSLEYGVELGKRLEFRPTPLSGLEQNIARMRQTILINQDAEQRMAELGAITAPGTAFTKSNLFVPMMVGDDLKGYVSLQNVDRENAFSESDVRLLQTLANSMSVALENARLFDETQRLLKETEQHNAELAIINSVQEGLARKLDFRGIVDLVGEKIGEIFKSDTVDAGMYDAERDWVNTLYYVDRGRRSLLPDNPTPRPSLIAILVDTHKPLLLGTGEEAIGLGSLRIPSGDAEKDGNESYLGVPILTGDRVIGWMAIQSYEQNAYDQADLRLLQTLANAMSVALENARLFDETQRLLKETEDHAAELAIINSVQQGLASKLDMQAIYDLVGDKVKEIFKADTTYIGIYHPDKEVVISQYYVESGQSDRRHHLTFDPFPMGPGLYTPIIRSRQPLLVGNVAEQRLYDAIEIPSPDSEKDLNET